MKSEIEKLRELRKEVERKMKRVSDYIDTDTFQRAKGKQKESKKKLLKRKLLC